MECDSAETSSFPRYHGLDGDRCGPIDNCECRERRRNVRRNMTKRSNGPPPSRIHFQIRRSVGLPRDDQSVLRDLPALSRSLEMKVVVTANIPDWLGWTVFGRKMTRLHVAEGGRIVALHIDLIVGEGMLRHREDLSNQPIGRPGKTVGAENLAWTIGSGRHAHEDIDFVGLIVVTFMPSSRRIATCAEIP
jgi:hypothetical protein